MSNSKLKRKYLLTFVQKDNREKKPESWVTAVRDNFSENEPYKQPKCDPPFENIPDDIFLRICSFLPMRDVWRIGSVCTKWYNFTRGEKMCSRFDIASLNLSRRRARKLLFSLPEFVKELRIGNTRSYGEKQMVSVPDLFYTLLQRFPQLKTLIIENVNLLKPYTEFMTNCGFMLNCKAPVELQVRRYFQTMAYQREGLDADFYSLVYLLRDLTVLSLRNSMLAVNKVLNTRIAPSKIRVLDLTNFLSASDATIRTLCQLPFLEELYLAGTSITVNGVYIILKEVPRLKVLDLDGTVVGGETFEVLKDYGHSLVEIGLGRTAVRDCDIINVDEGAFPALKKLCLYRTQVSEIGIKKLLLSVKSLSNVTVTKSKVKLSWILDQPVYMRAILVYDDSHFRDECNHFLQNEFHGAF